MTRYFSCLIFIFILFCKVKAQDTEWLVSEMHTYLHNGDMENARKSYHLLKGKVPSYIGFYSGAFDLYISLCTEQLNLNIGEDEIAKIYDMCISDNGITTKTKGKILSEIAATLCDYGLSSLGLSYYQELLELEKDLEPIYFYRYLMDLGWTYNKCQMPQKAYLTFKRCGSYYKDKFGRCSKNYAKALTGMTYVARFINVDNLNLLQEEHGIFVNNGDTLSNQYAVCLDNLGSYYNKRNDFDKALFYALKANRIFEETDPKGRDLAISFNNIGAIYKGLSAKDSSFLSLAESYLVKSMQIEPTTSAALNLALFYDDQVGLPDKAMEYYDYLGDYDRHNVYAMDVGNHYAHIGDYAEYASYMTEYINYIRMVQQQNVPFMSASERNNYIELIQNERMEKMFDLAVEARHESLPGLCFNYLLMSKSLLLSYDANIDEIINRTNNKKLKDMYFSLRVLHHNLHKKPMLKEKIDSLEHVFLDKLSKEENFSSFTSLEFKNIQGYLHSNDAIIEFYESKSSRSPRLYAVVLTANNQPIVINCCSVKEEKIFWGQKTLAQSLWNSLEPILKGKQRIFFVPDGKLHDYPLESYFSLICPQSNIIRISSSRELVRRYPQTGNGAAIYGGLNFCMGINQMIADAHQYRNNVVRGLTNDEISPQSIRYSIAELTPLPATLTEATNIATIISTKKKIGVQTFSGERGTETSFKSLSGKHKRILHIATHGYYNEGQNKQDDVCNVLSHSGLFFAGANNKYVDDVVPDTIDDGILTAQEISELDFGGVELVGLSACQTAQGVITGDGVFGLQRGFKKAGVKSILMSLWKVDDDATCKLMTEFYTNWITRKMTKHDALETAKKVVRETKGWEDPKYWAPFILLDALD